MKEADWLACTDPAAMLELLRGKASARKLLLFGCACLRRALPSVSSWNLLSVVQAGERFAERLANPGELERLLERVAELAPGVAFPLRDPTRAAEMAASIARRIAAGRGEEADRGAAWDAERTAQAGLLRELF